MKVDQYRVLKAKEWSFAVPAGKDLDELRAADKEILALACPYALERSSVDLDSIVPPSELAKCMADLEQNAVVALLAIAPAGNQEESESSIE